jgi:bacillithiol system protein YtxJ
MPWIPLHSEDQLLAILAKSSEKVQVIFKHSTRCSVSSMVLNRLEKAGLSEGLDFYLLDLIAYRQVSNLIADQFGVWHESPQILLIKNGSCIFDESHMGIQMREILEQAAA